MNIFATDNCPEKSAQALDNLRINKMIIESAQMLSTVARSNGFPSKDCLFKAAWHHHPCTMWAGASRKNFQWLVDHTIALATEWNLRGFKYHSAEWLPHVCQSDLDDCLNLMTTPSNQGLGLTPFANCTPYKGVRDPVDAYRYTMADKWSFDVSAPRWGLRGSPVWLQRYRTK
jgi:Pyrimidine dimer DNA glycosylase